MPTNRYPGTCYRCGERVEKDEGHFERIERRGWRVQHKECAIFYRGTAVGNTEPRGRRPEPGERPKEDT